MKKLFTERHGLTEPRVKEELDVELTKGLLTVIKAKISENLFAEQFPDSVTTRQTHQSAQTPKN